MKVALFGYQGKVGRVLEPALEEAGHEVKGIGRDDPVEVDGLDAAVHFTRPDVAFGTIRACLEQGVPSIVGTSGLEQKELDDLGGYAQEQGLSLFVAPNFAVGAVLMIRLAAEAARYLPRTEIVELHHETRCAKGRIPDRRGEHNLRRRVGAWIEHNYPLVVAIHELESRGLGRHQE